MNEGCEKVGFEPGTPCSGVQPLGYGTAAAESMENLWYLCTVLINVYVASPDPDSDPNPRGGGQLPNPNECSSTLTSGTNNIYPYPYIDVNDRGHCLRITHMPRWWGRYHEPQRWIPSHDGGVSGATTVDTEPRRWSIMIHDGGYRAKMVEYHEPRWWIPSHDGGVS